MTEHELRQKIVNTAVGYIGCKESDGSHRKIIDLYNAHTPLARGYKVKYTDAWCSTFASAVAIKCGLTDIIPTECGCQAHIALFLKHPSSKWQENGTITPKPGDYIFYNWDDVTQPNDGHADHVGIVEAVTGNTITVIEGNISNSVGRRKLAIGHGQIRGYGLPNYAEKAAGVSGTQGGGTGSTAGKIHTVVAGDTLSKVAAQYGITLATLVAANGIVNQNHITVGQILMLEITAAAAVAKLAALGVITSPDHWAQAASAGRPQHLEPMLIKAAVKIKKAGRRTATAEEGVAALATAGVINTPDYWLANYKTIPNLDALLCALGGAVK